MAKLQKRENLNYDEIDYGTFDASLPDSEIKEIFNCPVDLLEISKELQDVQSLMPISEADRETLKKDIQDAGIIRDPIKTYKKGKKFLILGGYNRWNIAQELGWETVPVEVLDVNQAVRKNLVIDDNLSRRQLTEEQKIMLLAERYPGYYKSEKETFVGRPKKNGDTVSPFSPVEEISKKSGLSKRQVIRTKKTYQEAKKEAKGEGRKKPDLVDIKKAKEAGNAERRAKEKAAKTVNKKTEPKIKPVIKKDNTQLNQLMAEREQVMEDMKNIKVLVEPDSNAITLLCKNDVHMMSVLTELEKHISKIQESAKKSYLAGCKQSVKKLDSRIKEAQKK